MGSEAAEVEQAVEVAGEGEPVEEAIAADQAAKGREVVVPAADEAHPEARIATVEAEQTQETTGPITKSADEQQCIPLRTCMKRVSSGSEEQGTAGSPDSVVTLSLTGSVSLCGIIGIVEGAAPRVLDVMEFAEVNNTSLDAPSIPNKHSRHQPARSLDP